MSSSLVVDRAVEARAVAQGIADAVIRAAEFTDNDGLAGLSRDELLEFMTSLERARNQASVLDHAVVREADARALGRELLCRTTAGLLGKVLRIGSGEARRRVAAAHALTQRRALNGEELCVPRPVLAAAQRAGQVNPEQVAVIVDYFQWLERAPHLDPSDVVQAETVLTGYADTFGPSDLRRLAARVGDALFPDGTPAAESAARDLRAVTLTDVGSGRFNRGYPGSSSGGLLSGRVTASLRAKLFAVLSPLAAPRPTDASGPDERTASQRMHDALEDLCDRALRSGGLPASGGTPATVVITIDYRDLLSRTGVGVTGDGSIISAREVLHHAAEADVIPVVLDAAGAPLHLGRSRRIATPSQTLALIARDAGCSFPGCGHPPDWCERHHVVPWIEGGTTNLDNLTLLCGYHHREFAERGWRCRMRSDGHPEWIPPGWLDPGQVPLANIAPHWQIAGQNAPGPRHEDP